MRICDFDQLLARRMLRQRQRYCRQTERRTLEAVATDPQNAQLHDPCHRTATRDSRNMNVFRISKVLLSLAASWQNRIQAWSLLRAVYWHPRSVYKAASCSRIAHGVRNMYMSIMASLGIANKPQSTIYVVDFGSMNILSGHDSGVWQG